MKQGTDDNTVAKLSGISVLFLPSSLFTLFRQCEKKWVGNYTTDQWWQRKRLNALGNYRCHVV